MSSNDDQDHSHLKGFVIITLPPADNPSLGKTITAFTVSNHPQNQPQNHPQNQPSNLPISLNRPRSNFVTYPRRRISFTIMGIFLFAFLTFISIQSPQNLLKLGSLTEVDQDNDEKESNQTNSFVFPLYSKLGFGGMMDKRDMEVKLGKFMMFGSKSSVLPLDDGVVGNKVVASSSAVLPVNGDELRDGLYYTQIDVGNPPRPYFLDVDTGSDLTWIQCDAPCTSCAKGAHPYYKPARGNILSSKDSYCYDVQQNSKSGHCESCSQCDYEIEYADHSSSLGVLSKDDLRLVRMNDTSVNSEVIFGCAYDQQGILLNSLTKTDGILGLSRAKIVSAYFPGILIRRFEDLFLVEDVTTNKEVQAVSKYSVEEYNRLKGNKDNDGPLMFVKVVEAEKQVVSGMKYYLTIEVVNKTSGEVKVFEAFVVVKVWLRKKELVKFAPSQKTMTIL